ncbi:MAG: hypothetical protein U9P71_04500 [Campylobacterota bacterium]|nr:hypothetical protein [Campylobacterota bacterium]
MKNIVVQNIQKAKESHLSQLHYIQLLVRGIKVEENKIFKSQYDCVFGQWLFGEGSQLKEHLDRSLLDEIESLHAIWHDEYLKIYQIFFLKKSGMLTRFLGKDVEVSAMDRDRAKAYLNDLEATTERLIVKLDIIIRKAGALGITSLK